MASDAPKTEPSRAVAASAFSVPAEAATTPGKDKPLLSSVDELRDRAKVLRRHIVTMIGKANSGHPGGSLSAVEAITALYFRVLRHRPKEPHWEDRDRFILSKGHAAPALYAALAECGYFPVAELDTLRQLDSRLQGHPDMNLTPGVEMSTGSLGQGLSFAIGVALAGKLDGRSYRVYVLLGDGECDEGQVWEAAMAASHFKLDHLIAIVDRNQLQLDGPTSDIMNLEPLADKWRSFGWRVLEADGHDLFQLVKTLEKAQKTQGQPTAIISHTIKGKGVSFMENKVEFHGQAPTPQQVQQALQELI